MDSKKTIKQFVGPNLVPQIILLLIPFIGWFFGLILLFFTTIPEIIRTNKGIAKLEAAGKLEQAAAEIKSATAKRFVNGNIILTDNYIFCKNNGFIFTYDEVQWAYRHRFTQTALFIPIKVSDSLYLATATLKPRGVVSMGKDKLDEIKNVIVEIYRHNNNCLVGYSQENIAKYRALSAR